MRQRWAPQDGDDTGKCTPGAETNDTYATEDWASTDGERVEREWLDWHALGGHDANYYRSRRWKVELLGWYQAPVAGSYTVYAAGPEYVLVQVDGVQVLQFQDHVLYQELADIESEKR